MTDLVIFLAGSALLAVVSRKSFHVPVSHGFYRFLAWEAMLGLLILNRTAWFVDPLSVHQIVSWLLLMISTVLVIDGARLLYLVGKPDAARQDESLLDFEKTSRLVTSGTYRYIRHPLYSSLIFLTGGIFFKDPTWVGLLLAAAASSFLVMTARADEKECIRFFGQEYEEYMKRTKMFVPFVL
jgi:protein-S-isoprenylcysteine O-methyltransferase Ste14